MNVGHHSLEDQFHRARWVPNTFPSCNITSELKLRVDRPMFILVIFNIYIVTRKQNHVLYLRLYLGPKPCNFPMINIISISN